VIDDGSLVVVAARPPESSESPHQLHGVTIQRQPFALFEQVAMQLFDRLCRLPLG
jgi:hypothetical protein